ncbi:MAG: DUF2203 family protein [Dehalococcoidia bacterium]|nr:DUF2203 family protein [Dehalococcoidia bacterium]
MSPRYFTLQEASAELPWLIERLTEIRGILADVENLKASSDSLIKKAGSNGHSKASPDPDKMQADAEQANRKVRDILRSVAEKGIILRDHSTGLSDFPSKNAEGIEIYLCWLSGEERIAFWHTPESGFAGRQPL